MQEVCQFSMLCNILKYKDKIKYRKDRSLWQEDSAICPAKLAWQVRGIVGSTPPYPEYELMHDE